MRRLGGEDACLVLEENQRLAEEKDHLRRTIHSLNKTVEDLAHRAVSQSPSHLRRVFRTRGRSKI